MDQKASAKAAEEFVEALESLLTRMQQSQRKLFREAKLTPLHFYVLRWLSRDRHAHASELAKRLGIRPQTMTPIIDALEEGGFLRRVPSPIDRRAVLLVLTSKGIRQVRALRAAQVQLVRRGLEDQPLSVVASGVRALSAIGKSFPEP